MEEPTREGAVLDLILPNTWNSRAALAAAKDPEEGTQ